MLGLNRWTPFTGLADLHRGLDSLFGRVFGDATSRHTADAFVPAADVRREGDKWTVSLAVPGISPDKLDIEVLGRTLRVRGERPFDKKAQSVTNEIAYGRFEREFTLPEEIDADHVEATYRNGMLELTLPLNESVKPRRIEVTSQTEPKQIKAA